MDGLGHLVLSFGSFEVDFVLGVKLMRVVEQLFAHSIRALGKVELPFVQVGLGVGAPQGPVAQQIGLERSPFVAQIRVLLLVDARPLGHLGAHTLLEQLQIDVQSRPFAGSRLGPAPFSPFSTRPPGSNCWSRVTTWPVFACVCVCRTFCAPNSSTRRARTAPLAESAALHVQPDTLRRTVQQSARFALLAVIRDQQQTVGQASVKVARRPLVEHERLVVLNFVQHIEHVYLLGKIETRPGQLEQNGSMDGAEQHRVRFVVRRMSVKLTQRVDYLARVASVHALVELVDQSVDEID
ncbi:hypothetical protein BpHYR1_005992 [Brachionus plicatilis]|uniref:Uncharacterized protein n=1 Tax=Brachionus plicatilis TaxID=10195 RepID=A0A3M7SWA6_BRAPC|nr:hypothetical protein BpHYR1_005992 [Brachionus plicatilis]